jgi:glycosyltransferase involved in cell wall biosynthesis
MALGSRPSTHGSVLIVSRCAQTISAQRRALMTGLRTLGWAVRCAGETEAGDPYPKRIAAQGFDFHPLPVRQKSSNPFALLKLILACVVLMLRTRPKVVHAFTIKPMIAATLAAWLTGVPVRLVTVAGAGHLFLGKTGLIQRLSLMLLRLALRRAHKVIFYNRDDEQLFRAHKLVLGSQVAHVAGSGIDMDYFHAAPMPDANTPFTLLYIGRFLREKGVGDLLEAARLLKGRGSSVRIILLGDVDGNNPSSLRLEDVAAAIHAGLVTHLPTTDDVRSHIAAAHAVILPSYREGIPLVLLEAGAMARPVIATDAPGCRDVVRDGETGMLVPVGDPMALAEAISKMAPDQARAVAMGIAGRLHVGAHFSSAEMSARVAALYTQCLNGIVH